MKWSCLLTVVLAFASPTFAFSSTEIKGTEAEILISAFEKIGAFFDSGAGHVGTEISDLYCNVDKFLTDTNSCSLLLQSETGEMVSKRLYKSQANTLIEALMDVGIGGCGTESCGGFEAKSITCTSRLAPVEDDGNEEDRSICVVIQE